MQIELRIFRVVSREKRKIFKVCFLYVSQLWFCLFFSYEDVFGFVGVYKWFFIDDNYVDWMSYYYINMFLFFYIMFFVFEEWFEFLVKCFCFNIFMDEEVIYVIYVCWVEKMYFVLWNSIILSDYDI